MDGLVGLLKIRVVRGINLAYRDTRGSDPYVVLRLGKQVWLLFCFYISSDLPHLHLFCLSIYCSQCLTEFCVLIILQKVKTSVKKKSVNPIWHEELTLSIMNPIAPIKLVSGCCFLTSMCTNWLWYFMFNPVFFLMNAHIADFLLLLK